MTSKNDGGPAFPVSEYVTHNGMSLRDHLAAHAPDKPQAWFEPVVPDLPKPPEYIDNPSFVEWKDRPWIQRLLTSKNDPWDHFRRTQKNPDFWEWEVRAREVGLKQWPYAWADAVIAERNNINSEHKDI